MTYTDPTLYLDATPQAIILRLFLYVVVLLVSITLRNTSNMINSLGSQSSKYSSLRLTLLKLILLRHIIAKKSISPRVYITNIISPLQNTALSSFLIILFVTNQSRTNFIYSFFFIHLITFTRLNVHSLQSPGNLN